MPFKFFTVPIRDDGSAEAELNAFLRSHRVLAVDRRWVDKGADSFWSICVDYSETGGSGVTVPGRMMRGRGKDYKEILTPEDFAVLRLLEGMLVSGHEARTG